jgi:hypothetical protein
MIFVAKNSNKFQKLGFGRKNSIENVGTLG